MGVLRKVSDLLMSPARGLTDPVERGSARLLSACLLVLALVFGTLDLTLSIVDEGHVPPWPGYALMGGAYALSRTSLYRWGAIITTAMFPMVAVGMMASGNQLGIRPFAFVLLAPFFASLFLGVRGATIFAVFSPALVAALPFVFGVPFIEVVDTIAANIMGGLVAVSYALHREWIERRREEEGARHEAELIHLQKMEAIGRMAGGIAHDFNNLLTVIAGGTELLARSSNKKELRLIESATRSAQDLTEQLLTLSRQQVVGKETTDVALVVDGTQQLLSRIIGEDIRLELQVDPMVGAISLSKGQLQQVLLNLATNARDAMPKGGVLTFKARREGHDSVRLIVRDSGEGMDEGVRAKVFEPFFTTKRMGEGTGLGLSTVFGLVTQAGGTIEVDSTPGRGTTFSLLLPRVEEKDSDPGVLSDRRLSLGGTARGRILLVEDDASVRELCRSVLRKEGYDVTEASDPAEALELFLGSHERCDLLITDVVMPVMSGPELAETMRRSDPELPVLFVSGYAPDDVVGDGLPSGEFLPKPFRPTELLRRVTAMLYGLDSQAPPAAEETITGEVAIPSASHLPRELKDVTTEPPVSHTTPKNEPRRESSAESALREATSGEVNGRKQSRK